ncbi:hypothetical protein [Amycolatopsis thermoflava]|uniref:hypothetical protein n=1 Tax=Amycolatopsis thermoflava TaxID=84480 RepID=UPI0004164168|nr:hypothetical protein [Amycolatopsis thermoflava]
MPDKTKSDALDTLTWAVGCAIAAMVFDLAREITDVAWLGVPALAAKMGTWVFLLWGLALLRRERSAKHAKDGDRP